MMKKRETFQSFKIAKGVLSGRGSDFKQGAIENVSNFSLLKKRERERERERELGKIKIKIVYFEMLI